MNRHDRKACAAALVFALSLMFAIGALGETLTCIAPEGQYVNVRKQASSTAATWGILHGGDTIEIQPQEIQNGFFKTEFKDREAYVSVRYFEMAEGRDYEVVANGRVRMRTSPGGSADGFIQPSQRVHVIAWRYAGDGSRWARCAGGRYISADYLRLEGGAAE